MPRKVLEGLDNITFKDRVKGYVILYYRQHPDEFVEKWLELELLPFQKILLRTSCKQIHYSLNMRSSRTDFRVLKLLIDEWVKEILECG